MIQAVFFDFNGVVIDDEPLQMKAYQEVLGREGLEVTESDYYGSMGMHDVAFLRAAYARAGRELDEETLGRVMQAKTEAHRKLIGEEPPLFPGVVTFVKALSRRYKLGLVSMARRTEIDYVLERAGLAGYFAVVVSGDGDPPHKPDPSCYNDALAALNSMRGEENVLHLRPEECLVIEDSPPGVRSARAAGMRTLGVANTVSDKELRDAGADVATRTLSDWTPDAVHHVFDTEWGRG